MTDQPTPLPGVNGQWILCSQIPAPSDIGPVIIHNRQVWRPAPFKDPRPLYENKPPEPGSVAPIQLEVGQKWVTRKGVIAYVANKISSDRPFPFLVRVNGYDFWYESDGKMICEDSDYDLITLVTPPEEDLATKLSFLESEVESLRYLCAAAYQVVGVANGPVEMLDNLAAAAQGESFPHKPGAGIPWIPTYDDEDLNPGAQ